MFIKYHLIYYALCLFLYILALYNPIFYLLLIVYLIFFIHKTSVFNVLIFLIIILLITYIKPNSNTTFQSQISGIVVSTSDNYCIVKCDRQKVKVYNDEHFKYHDKVTLKLQQYEINNQRNDNGFNEELFLKANNIQIKAKCIKVISRTHKYNLVDFIEERLSKDSKTKSYQRLFVLGVKDSNIQDDYDKLLSLSVVHLFALSGMHITYLKKFIERFFVLFISKEKINYIVYILLFLYLINIPFSISLWRAFLMLLLYDLLHKHLNKLDVYAIVSIIFMLYNRYIIFNYSFMFSFGIYLIVLLCSNMKYSSFYVYIFSLPFIIYANNQIYLISFLLTYFLTPFIELFYQVILISIFIPITSKLVTIMVVVLTKIITFSSIFDTHLIFRTPNLSFIVFFYCISIRLLIKKQLKLNSQKEHCYLIALLLFFYIYGSFPIYASVTMIDVGQGDSCLIRLPFNQGNILIDTGGNRNYDIATNTLIPYFKSQGISKIDYVYISHDDYDHCGALDSLKENFKVKHIIKKYEKKRQIGNLKIEMLNTNKEYDNNNDKSLIMKLTLYNYKFLFMGDASTKVEADLLEKYKHIDIDFIKIGHHGSKSSSGVDLFSLVSPKIALIGVGKNNYYKHPSDIVIDRLNKKGITILRTDTMGMFSIRFYYKDYYIFK